MPTPVPVIVHKILKGEADRLAAVSLIMNLLGEALHESKIDQYEHRGAVELLEKLLARA
jgi:hypothetical protein